MAIPALRVHHAPRAPRAPRALRALRAPRAPCAPRALRTPRAPRAPSAPAQEAPTAEGDLCASHANGPKYVDWDIKTGGGKPPNDKTHQCPSTEHEINYFSGCMPFWGSTYLSRGGGRVKTGAYIHAVEHGAVRFVLADHASSLFFPKEQAHREIVDLCASWLFVPFEMGTALMLVMFQVRCHRSQAQKHRAQGRGLFIENMSRRMVEHINLNL